MRLPRLVLFVLLVSLALGSTSYGAEDQEIKRVRVIFGFESLGLWEHEFTATINQAIIADPRVVFAPEFIPLDAFEIDSFSLFSEYERLRPKNTDLIIAVQPEATAFMNQWGATFFPDIPILYVIPDNETANAVISTNSGIVLPSAIEAAAKETLQLIPQLIPDLEHLYILSGSSPGDYTYLERLRNIVAELDLAVEIQYIVGLTPNELVEELNVAPPNSAGIFGTYNRDNAGQRYNTRDLVLLTQENISIPLFGIIDSTLDAGIVGGSMTSAKLYAEKTAEAMLSILYDDSSPNTLETVTGFFFDDEQLDRFDIDKRLLPTDSTIINQDLGLLEQYFWQFVIGVTVVAIQMFFIVALASSLRRRKKAEQERDRGIVVQENQDKLFESVIDSIPDAIFITDAAGTIIAINKGTQALFDVDEKELIGRQTEDLLKNSVKHEDPTSDAPITLGTQIEPEVLSYTSKNGRAFFGETIATQVIYGEGESLGYFALIRDVTKRLSQEEEKRQGQKMEALGNLVGGVSHDFNNILGVISGYGELLSKDQDAELFEKNRGQILKATNRAKSLVSQIMTFSRDSNIEQKLTDLNEAVDDTIKLLQASIPSSIKIEVHKDSSAQLIMGSPIQLQQIVLNLTTNAYQAMNDIGGTINIALDKKIINTELLLSHGVLTSGHYSCLSISDDGPGMTREVYEKVFEPFFTTKGQGKGSGMGMTIVYNLLKAHNAKLNLITNLNEGTCFTVYFKEAKGTVNTVPKKKKQAIVRGKGERVLLVDDETDLLDSTRQLLSSIGYLVTAINDPTNALEALKQSPEEFDLLVSDQTMPKINGLQLLKAALDIKPDLPTIICTGNREEFNRQAADYPKVSFVLTKPFTLGDISAAIHSALNA